MKLLEPETLIIILVIVLIIFGPKQLPQLGKSLGKTMKSIRDGMEEDSDEQRKETVQTSANAKDSDEAE